MVFYFTDFIKNIEEITNLDNNKIKLKYNNKNNNRRANAFAHNSTSLKYFACLTKYIIDAYRFVVSLEFFVSLSLSFDRKTEKATK